MMMGNPMLPPPPPEPNGQYFSPPQPVPGDGQNQGALANMMASGGGALSGGGF
jgi:hypothetical protein